MATPPSTVSPFRRAAGRWSVAALSGTLMLSLLALAGCSQKPGGPASPSAATATGAPRASATPSSAAEVSYAEITAKYEAPVPKAEENGWPIVKPLLAAGDDPAAPLPSERLGVLALADNPKDLAYFDGSVLPVLKDAFSKPSFTEPHPLLSGQDPLSSNYRDLRLLCDLLAERADLLWKEGKRDDALELLRLPLSLAKAVQSRPETVSVNLFSSTYASASLRAIADWASSNGLKDAQLGKASALLAEFRPSYSHLARCISVDLAQLQNSLDDESTRTEGLGLGLARPEDVKVWKGQLDTLHTEGQKLYSFESVDPQAFNQAVGKMSPQISGLVPDYPELTTLQKRGFASYLATELALALERHRMSGDKKPLDATTLLSQTFKGDEEAGKAAAGLLEYDPGKHAGSFSIKGRGNVFQLVAPDGVSFYER